MSEVREKLNEILDEIAAANQQYTKYSQEESTARSNATSVKNRINELQKEFDKTLAVVKQQSAYGSDWYEETHPRRENESILPG